MDIAKCTEDGVTYTAENFSRLPNADIARKRRLLRCPECKGPAFFRHASPIGRAPCFGGRPHAVGCGLAAQDFLLDECAGDNQGTNHILGSKIIVDLQYGAPAQQDDYFGIGRTPMQERVGRNYSQPHYHLYHRRLGPLLRTLIESPELGVSDVILGIDGRGEFTARDFFLPLQSATYQYSGHFRGYWGVLSDAKLAPDNSLWLNSGGCDNISFCLDSKYVDVIVQRYGIKDLEDVAGAYILVIGTPRVSPNGKLYCLIDDPACMTLRLT